MKGFVTQQANPIMESTSNHAEDDCVWPKKEPYLVDMAHGTMVCLDEKLFRQMQRPHPNVAKAYQMMMILQFDR